MPAGLIALLPALIGAGTAATTTGLQLAGAFTPSTPKAAPPAATGPTAQQVTAAGIPQGYNIESATGGSISPDYLSQIVPLQTGTAGQTNTPTGIQAVLDQILGKTPGQTPGAGGVGTAPFTASGMPVNLGALAQQPGLSDFLTKLAGGLS